AYQPETLRRAVDQVVLEVDVLEVGRNAPGKGQDILPHGERVAGVEVDPHARAAHFLADSHHLGRGKVLVVLNGDGHARLLGQPAHLLEALDRRGQVVRPGVAHGAAVSTEDRADHGAHRTGAEGDSGRHQCLQLSHVDDATADYDEEAAGLRIGAGP